MSLKYFNPLWYPYAVTIKPAMWVAKKVFDLPLRILRKTKPKNPVLKALWYVAFIYTIIPGSIPFAILMLTGKEEEAMAMLNLAVDAGVIAWDTAVKLYDAAPLFYELADKLIAGA